MSSSKDTDGGDPATASPPPFLGPIDIRSIALSGIFLILTFAALRSAWTLFLPMFLALLAALALTPIVRLLQRLGVPIALGSAIVLGSLLGLLLFGVSSLSEPAQAWLARAPRLTHQLEQRLRSLRSPLERITDATESVEALTGTGDPTKQVELKPPRTLAQVLFDRTQLALAMGTTTLALLYFLLASGDGFLQKLVEALPRLSDKKRAVTIIRRIESDISRYLLTVSGINAGLGIVVAAALFSLGMPTPVLWGTMVAILNFIPFLGALCSGAILTAVALFSYDSLSQAFLVPAIFTAITSVEGLLITPALLGRRLALSPVAVFASLMLWTWLWGVPGALIAVPILAIVKIVFDRTESLQPLGTFLSR